MVKRLYPTEKVKYLGVLKLIRVYALLFKIRKYVSFKMLISICFAIFESSLSYLSYCSLVWAQISSTIQRIVILPKKVIRIICFQPKNFHTCPRLKQSSILKFQDKICLENVLFISKSLNNKSPSVFNPFVPNAPFLYPLKASENRKGFCCFLGVKKGCIGSRWVYTWFSFCSDQNNYETSNSR